MVKNQHYVPQVYFRSFLDGGESINAFDKFEGKRFNTNIRNIASEKFFYDLESEVAAGHVEQTVEDVFNKIETRMTGILGSFSSQLKAGAIDATFKLDMAEVLATLILRTKEQRLKLKEGFEKTLKHTLRIVARHETDVPHEFIDMIEPKIKDEFLPNIHADFIFSRQTIDMYAHILGQHLWYVHENSSHMGFYTSDNPVAMHGNADLGPYGNRGLAVPGIEIHFPLTNRHEIVILERTFWKHLAKYENQVIPCLVENVQHANHLQLLDSTRFVYSADNNFFIARTFREQYPEYCKERERVRIN